MTFAALLKRLQKMSPDQLKKQVRLYEGCSGNWTVAGSVYLANRATLQYDAAYESEPPLENGEPYICHDH